MKKNQLWIVAFVSVFLLMLVECEAKDTTKICKSLGRVTDIDNLLFQMYSNIDNQCLFEMPPEKLEAIWGISVLDFTAIKEDKKDLLRRESRRIFTERNGFFIRKINVEAGILAFSIEPTKQYILRNGWGGAIGRGEYPQLLPKPKIVSDFYDSPYEVESSSMHGHRLYSPPQTVYQQYTKYYWLNSLRSDLLPVLFFETSYFGDPLAIYLYSEARVLDFE